MDLENTPRAISSIRDPQTQINPHVTTISLQVWTCLVMHTFSEHQTLDDMYITQSPLTLHHNVKYNMK